MAMFSMPPSFCGGENMTSFEEMVKQNRTMCFFCGKETTGMTKECNNPECIEKYRKVKEEKKHPFFV